MNILARDTLVWNRALNNLACLLREEFRRQYLFDDDGDVSPSTLALRDAVFAFPFATDILLFDVGSAQSPGHYGYLFYPPDMPPSPMWTLIAHHVASLDRDVRFHGCRNLAELDDYKDLLLDDFGFWAEQLESIKTLGSSGYWACDYSKIVDLVPYDVSEQPEVYAKYLAHNLLGAHSSGLIARFKKRLNFSNLYSLPEDTILSLEELTQIDELTACFARLSDGRPPSIEDRQRDVAEIQLIPKVPSDVCQTFRRAKDAYIFGYFRYGFFTISVHYASLALEAAIKARWSASLPQKVLIRCVGDEAEVNFPSYSKIEQLVRQRKDWTRRPVNVGAEKFPSSTHRLLDWLVEKKIATRWERRRLAYGLHLRNQLSHLEHAATDMPRPDTLKTVAESINKLFHGLP